MHVARSALSMLLSCFSLQNLTKSLVYWLSLNIITTTELTAPTRLSMIFRKPSNASLDELFLLHYRIMELSFVSGPVTLLESFMKYEECKHLIENSGAKVSS